MHRSQLTINNASTTGSSSSSNAISMDIDPSGGSLHYDMTRSLALTAQESQECRPATTKRAYSSKANEFLKWAHKTFVHESEMERGIVSGAKLNFFIRQEVKILLHTCYVFLFLRLNM